MKRLAWLLALACCWPLQASAHSLTFSVLKLRELDNGQFVVGWERTQGVSDPSAAYQQLRPVFPEHCRFSAPQLRCGSGGLRGRIGFAGLSATSVTGIVKIEWSTGEIQSLTVSSSQPFAQVLPSARPAAGWASLHAVSARRWDNAASYIRLGVEHIWTGWDHLLFVLGLLWLVRTLPMLIQTITAFTVAHSVTLSAAALGFDWVPREPVEAVIALSIAFVALEIANASRSGGVTASLCQSRPWLVALSFGLLHGFGFANALAEIEIARDELPVALLCFNIGVELGQLAFVAAALALRRFALPAQLGSRTRALGYYVMGSIAMYWFFERVLLFGRDLS